MMTIMKKPTKLVAMLLALTMIVSFAACGEKSENAEQPNDSVTESIQQTDSSAKEPVEQTDNSEKEYIEQTLDLANNED